VREQQAEDAIDQDYFYYYAKVNPSIEGGERQDV
jgi:hypothetical protein